MPYIINCSRIIIMLAIMPIDLMAQPGSLVTTFGNEGAVYIDLGGHERMQVVALQSSDHIIAGGYTETDSTKDFFVARFDIDGQLDLSFGEDGYFRTEGDTLFHHEVTDLVVDGNDNIYVGIVSYNDLEVKGSAIKLTADGHIESSFGDEGQFVLEVNGQSWAVRAVTATSTGHLIVGSQRGGMNAFAKINSEGVPDSSFGNDGMVLIDVGNQWQNLRSIKEQPDGALICSGEAQAPGGDFRFFVMRINSTGLDSTFGGTGFIHEDFFPFTSTADGLKLQTDGKILLAGADYNGNKNNPLFVRYLPNGEVDPDFGENGLVLVPTIDNDLLYAVTILADNSIVGAGDQAVVKLLPDGSPDPNFGAGGVIRTLTQFRNYITDAVLDADENLIVVGSANTGINLDYFMAKYTTGETTSSSLLHQKHLEFKTYPNPFDTNFSFEFELQNRSFVEAKLLDLAGRTICNLIEPQDFDAGFYREQISVPGRLSPGLYVLDFRVGGERYLRKLIK